MSYRYRQEYAETGNVVEPEGWNANQSELAQEFNGGMDSDNLPLTSIAQAMLDDNACNEVHDNTGSSSTSFVPSDETTTWQWEDSGGDVINEVTVAAPCDALLICEWSGNWTWDGTNTGGSYTAGTYNEDSVQFRITVDGTEVAVSGPLGDQRWKDATYLVGAIPVSPGPHAVRVELMLAKRTFDGLSITAKVTNSLTINDRELIVTERRR